MINQENLRKGNFVDMGLGGVIKIPYLGKKGFWYGLEFSDGIEKAFASYDNLVPVPINNWWKKNLNINFQYPNYIKSVHELQNWYYWNNEKKDFNTSGVPMSRGDHIQEVDENELEKILESI